MVGIIFDILFARLEDAKLRHGLIGRNVVSLGGGVAAADHEDVGVAAGLERFHFEAFVLFFVDERVGSGGSELMAVEAILALGDLVFLGVENRLVVVGPNDGADSLGVIGQEFAGAKILDGERELAKASLVEGVSQEIAVGAGFILRHAHELVPFGELVDVEKDFLGGAGSVLFAAANPVLLSCFRPGVIEIVALFVRNLDVGFLDVAQHFVVELFLERLGGLHDRVGVGVLRLEIGADFGIGLVSQPEIVVDELVTVEVGGFRDFLCHRRAGQRCRGAGMICRYKNIGRS